MPAAHSVPRKPTVLIVMDGVGIHQEIENNAFALAATPRLDDYFSRYPSTLLDASGHAVGLPEGQGGNSEVGHLTLGSGMVLQQDLVRIDNAIKTGEFFQNAVLIEACDRALQQGRPLHLVGLVSDGGVHGHVRHLLALIDLATRCGVVPMLHLISDGRDTASDAVLRYYRLIEMPLRHAGGAVASVCGRYFAMDRNRQWDRTAKAWRAMTRAGSDAAVSVEAAIDAAYQRGQSDEFIEPVSIAGGEPIAPGDPVICFNYRNDRMQQLAAALAQPQFDAFDRGDWTAAELFTMTHYEDGLPAAVAFPKLAPEVTLGGVISAAGLRQLHVAETEKYAHVTFFFNGGRENALPGEERILVPSPDVSTYDLAPEMSAAAVADRVVEAIEAAAFDFIVVNFANGDMVGHTGVPEAIVRAVEAVDAAVGRVLDAALAHGYAAIVTADHGNCEEMVDPVSGKPSTSHTANPVPCLIVDDHIAALDDGHGLASVAPTVLELMGLPVPAAMHHGSLLAQRRLVAVA